MTGPQVDPLRDYIRSKLSERAQKEGLQVTPQQIEEATEHYAKAPGSEYRQMYYDEQATRGQQEAQRAQLGGSFGEGVQRAGRDMFAGGLRGITSIPRMLGHALSTPEQQAGMAGRQAAEQVGQQASGGGFEGWLNRVSGAGMGGRGLSPNPVLGTIQSMVEPAAEMAGAMPIANPAMKMTGNVLQNVANRAPQSRVLSALAGKQANMQGPAQAGAGAAIGRIAQATPSAAVKGVVGGAVAMPDETFAHGGTGTNLGFSAGLSALDALSAGRLPRAPREGAGVVGSIRELMRNPIEELPVKDDFGPAPDFAAPEAPAAPAAAPRAQPQQAGAPSAEKKGFVGGERIDFNKLDPAQAEASRKVFAGAKTPQERAKLLGAETEMGLAGKNPKTEVVENLTNAKGPEDLFGYLQKRLIKAATGGAPKFQPGVQPRRGKLQPSAATKISLDPDPGAGPGVDLTPPSSPAAAPSPRAVAGKRPPRQDVLAQAPRTPEGMLDWDKLDRPQRDAVAGMLGRDYREKVKSMSLANIQKVLSDAQFASFQRALERKPRPTSAPEAAPVEEVSKALDENLLAEPGEPEVPHIKMGGTQPRRGQLGSKTAAAVERAVAAHPVAASTLEPAASKVDESNVSPGWWDSSHATPEQKAALAKAAADRRQFPGDPAVWAATPFEQLPPFLKKDLAQMKAPAYQAEGGAPQKGAGFRGRRKQGAKPSPAQRTP